MGDGFTGSPVGLDKVVIGMEGIGSVSDIRGSSSSSGGSSSSSSRGGGGGGSSGGSNGSSGIRVAVAVAGRALSL